MNHLRKLIVLLFDGLILVCVATALALFSTRYNIGDAVGRGMFIPHMILLYICTLIFQLLFRTYDSLWRYAESQEYLSLLLAALAGFCTYEILTRYVLMIDVISFLLLSAIASLWVLGMLGIRFAYRVFRSQVQYRRGSHQVPIAIVGAGAAGIQLLD